MGHGRGRRAAHDRRGAARALDGRARRRGRLRADLRGAQPERPRSPEAFVAGGGMEGYEQVVPVTRHGPVAAARSTSAAWASAGTGGASRTGPAWRPRAPSSAWIQDGPALALQSVRPEGSLHAEEPRGRRCSRPGEPGRHRRPPALDDLRRRRAPAPRGPRAVGRGGREFPARGPARCCAARRWSWASSGSNARSSAGARGPRGRRPLRRPAQARRFSRAEAVPAVELQALGRELRRACLRSHGSTDSSACSSATPALNASSPRKPAAIFSASRRLSPSAGNALTRNSLLAMGMPDLHRGVPGGEHRQVVLVEVGDRLGVVRASSASGISSTQARTSSPSSCRRASRPTDSAMTRMASCGSMKHSGMRRTVGGWSDGFAKLFRTIMAASDIVFRKLAADVLAGRHAPGERLPTQRALAAELGVNMATVREGIKRLEQMNLIEVRHGDAMRVRDWRAHGGLDVLVHALGGGLEQDREVLRAVMEARRLLLAEAGRARRGAARRGAGRDADPPRGRDRRRRRRRGRPGRGLRLLRGADRGGGEPRAAADRQLDPRPLLRAARRLPRAGARPRPSCRRSTTPPRPRSTPATPTPRPRRGRRPRRGPGARAAGGDRVSAARAPGARAHVAAARRARSPRSSTRSPPPSRRFRPCADTDAVEAFMTWLAYAPRLNRAAFRVAVRLVGTGDRQARLAQGPPPRAARRGAALRRRRRRTTATSASCASSATTPPPACARRAPGAPRHDPDPPRRRVRDRQRRRRRRRRGRARRGRARRRRARGGRGAATRPRPPPGPRHAAAAVPRRRPGRHARAPAADAPARARHRRYDVRELGHVLPHPARRARALERPSTASSTLTDEHFERVEAALGVHEVSPALAGRNAAIIRARRRAARLVRRLPAPQRPRLPGLRRVRLRLPDGRQAARRRGLPPRAVAAGATILTGVRGPTRVLLERRRAVGVAAHGARGARAAGDRRGRRHPHAAAARAQRPRRRRRSAATSPSTPPPPCGASSTRRST